MNRVHIQWKSKTTWLQSNGKWCDISQEDNLKQWVAEMNRKYHELEHWLEYKQDSEDSLTRANFPL